MKYVIVGMFTILIGCGNTSVPESKNCGGGSEISVNDTTYCIFTAEITETGFNCPTDFPVLNSLEGGSLCSAGGVSDEDVLVIQQEANKKWGMREVDCETLDEAACTIEPECDLLMGAPLDEESICFFDDVFLACVDDAGGGDGAISFGRNPDNGTCWIFRENAGPSSWKGCGDVEDSLLGRECPGGARLIGQNPTFVECEDITKTVDYCAAETLDWAYNIVSKKLTLTDRRVVLNCCGERDMRVSLANGVYELIIEDRPEDQGRCDCSCVFDFGIEIPNIEPGPFEFEIYEIITDALDYDMKHKGTIDVPVVNANGSGSLELSNEDASIACVPD